MGFGAIIASGEKNKLLPNTLVDCITEVRVEQSLNEPAHFAIRFQEDLSGGQPHIKGAPELGCGQMITIAVKVGDEITCLVRGPITERGWSAMLGGPGSWYEVRGQDRRIEMDRQCQREIWAGAESDAATRILGKQEYEFRGKCIQRTNKVYGGAQGNEPTIETLNQRATDEAFLRQIARRNNMHFWIEYDCSGGFDATGTSLKVDEIANLRSSPLRAEDAEKLLDCQGTTLNRKIHVTLRVNVEEQQCQNVTAFKLTEDSERPSRFSGVAVDDRAGAVSGPTTATDRQPPLAKRGKRIDRCGFERDVCITTAGNIEELLRKASSALTEAGWFIEATASTTAHMLGGVLLPHDEVEVQGVGTEDGGVYQVKAVTHVINAADHFMDLELRRNATGGK